MTAFQESSLGKSVVSVVNKVGRPTKYKPEFCEQAFKFALLGAIDSELADLFEVSEAAINDWKERYPEFLQSIREGKVLADANVAKGLYGRAIGAEWVEQQAFKVKNQTAPGQFTEDVQIVDVRRAAPPDTKAAALWLSNRQGKRWKDSGQALGEAALTLAELVLGADRLYQERTAKGQIVDITPEDADDTKA